MDIQDLIAQWRREVSDESQPYLWDDDEALLFAIDAQDTFVRLIGGIADATTAAITDLAVTASTPFTAHSPHIVRIRSAKLLTAKRPIMIANEADLPSLRISDYGTFRAAYLDDTETGDVVAGVLGVEKNKIRWYKVPQATDTCRLNVMRLPYPRITDQDSPLEIGEHHHYHLIKWMKHLAYSKEDAETYDKDLADSNEATFRRYCDDAKQEEERQRFKPRVVQYGGIPW